ncbi:MAG: Ni/Fe-hydrogenase cytochrome b subunit [Lentisphaerae bacterium]|nr:Ni/Fe-hydrogenase cytochrome b subunit [Lentisphaerota bacterium]
MEATVPVPGARRRASLWRVAGSVILIIGLWLTVVRFSQGLGAVTNLSDQTPWGLWVAFDVMCGVALAAGGFTITALVHLMGQKHLYPMLRSTVLTAFLGYILVSVGLIYDLGKPYNIWHPLIMYNPHSVMFEVAWCVMLYSTVLALEFSPLVFERLGWHKPRKFIHEYTIPLVMAGVLLSTLHQSSLGTVFLVVPGKLYPLWYSPYLPLMFFLSALTVGFAMVIVESYLSSYFLKHSLKKGLIVDLSRFLSMAILVYLAAKFQDLFARGQLGALLEPRLETACFWLEILLLLVPGLLLISARVRLNLNYSFLCALMVVAGVVVNRMNVATVGMFAFTGNLYVPSASEIAVSVFLLTVGVVVFGLAVKYLNIFEVEESETHGEPSALGAGAAT